MKCWLAVCVAVVAAGCSEKKDPGAAPVDPTAFAKKHKAAIETFRAKLDAAATLVKDLPPTSTRIADPEGPFTLIRRTYIKDENAFIINGDDVPGLPEFGKYAGKDVSSGDTGISVAYSDFLDLESAFSMLEGGKPRFELTTGASDYLARRISQMRYVIIGREVAYAPGTIDKAAKSFTAGTFKGVAHVVDLQGPKHLGSVAYSASNSGSFESYDGSEKFILEADLNKATVEAFLAEVKKVFPKLDMPPKQQ